MSNRLPDVAFMGTPEFAVPVLRGLVEAGYPVVGVFSQPDRPKGRGYKLVPTPVKKAALELSLPVFQFERIRRREGVEALTGLEPDLIVTAAFGQILSQQLLDIPKRGCLNVHASLLPAHRGPAPVQWSIIMGDKATGVTIMCTDAGVDTGDVLSVAQTPIGGDENASDLMSRLSAIGASLLLHTIDGYLDGSIPPIPQNHNLSTHEPMLTRQDGLVDWHLPAQCIHDRVRGMTPRPGAWTIWMGEPLKIWQSRIVPGVGRPGEVLESGKRLVVAAGEDAIELCTIQCAGSKSMIAEQYLCGRPIGQGAFLGEQA